MFWLFMLSAFFACDVVTMQSGQAEVDAKVDTTTGLRPSEKIYRKGNAFCIAGSHNEAAHGFVIYDAMKDIEKEIERVNQERVIRARSQAPEAQCQEFHDRTSLAVGLEDLYRRDVQLLGEGGKQIFSFNCERWFFHREAKEQDFFNYRGLLVLYKTFKQHLQDKPRVRFGLSIKIGIIQNPEQQDFFLTQDHYIEICKDVDGSIVGCFKSCCDRTSKATGGPLPRGFFSYPVQGAIDIATKKAVVSEQRVVVPVAEDERLGISQKLVHVLGGLIDRIKNARV